MTNVLLNRIHSLYNIKFLSPHLTKGIYIILKFLVIVTCTITSRYSELATFVPRSELLVLMIRSAFGHPD